MTFKTACKVGVLALIASVLTACGQPAAPIAPAPAAVAVAALPAPTFRVKDFNLSLFLTCSAELSPLVPLGYPALDEEGRLYCPMLATYSGPVNGRIKGTLRGTDHVKAYLNPDYTLKAGDFDIIDVVTDEDGQCLVAKATGKGVVLKSGRVPFGQVYTVIESGGGATTGERYRHLLGRQIYSPGFVDADLTTVKMAWYM
jgi:hypothetical protein